MKRSQRLKIVLEIAERNEAAALKELQDVRQQLQLEVKRLREFEDYRADYQKQLSAATGASIDTTQYVNFQRFIAQLGTAIEQQQYKVQIAQQRVDKVTADWRILHEKTRGMSDHIENCRNSEQREEDIKEQKAIDELSSLRNAYRSKE